MEIDIRKQEPEDVSSIRFGDNDSDLVEYDIDRVYISRDDVGAVMMEDIDNLILALQKAKELW